MHAIQLQLTKGINMFFNNHYQSEKQMAMYAVAGITLAYLLFNAPVTLLFGLLLASALFVGTEINRQNNSWSSSFGLN